MMTNQSPQMHGFTTASGRMHWHVAFTHFPISLFGVTFLFQVLHLFLEPDAFSAASNVTLIGGTVMMIPTTWTGWRTWKDRYKGAPTPLFKRKTITAFVMLGLSVAIVAWASSTHDLLREEPSMLHHFVYFGGTTLLIVGSIIEGFYGGRLNHR